MPKLLIVQAMSDVARATQARVETSPKKAIEALVRCKVEACSEYHGNLVASPFHSFVAAVDAAFCGHRPLVLSPDNPWAEVFSEFSMQIKKHIGEQNYSNIVTSFSTTGGIEKAANELVLMDSMKSYFEYECEILCGIPEVTLEGTVEDWHSLHERTELLGSAYNLAWWTNRILPTLERIAHNATGADDPGFWKDIYKINDESGGSYITGWIINFFPYLQRTVLIDKERNKIEYNAAAMLENLRQPQHETIEIRNWTFAEGHNAEITTESLPGSLCRTPFKWQYLEREYDMEFLAGFIGFTQDADTLAVRPKIGWAVCEP